MATTGREDIGAVYRGLPVRHWFAWPGAAWAALRFLDAEGRLETALSAQPPG
jgi:hypothetical protein